MAIPTQKGQRLTVEENDTQTITWKSLDETRVCWFTSEFSMPLLRQIQGDIVHETQDRIKTTLFNILTTAQELNPEFLATDQGYTVTTKLEFHRQWGLGSSSTLINNIAQWANVNAFELLEKSFGGSGYDIACAQYHTPILYQRNAGTPIVQPVVFDPPFKDHLFFVYLNNKQNSKASIAHYRSLATTALASIIKEVNELTDTLLECTSLTAFEQTLNTHEALIATTIKTPTVASRLFPNYTHSIKSLGGWGGDFILVTGTVTDMDYFKHKGYTTIIPYQKMLFSTYA